VRNTPHRARAINVAVAERLARLPPTPDELRALLPRLLQWVVEGLPVAPVIHVGPPIRGYPGTLFIGVLCPYCYRDHVRGWDGQGAYGHRWEHCSKPGATDGIETSGPAAT
jgi:hypothetical protein